MAITKRSVLARLDELRTRIDEQPDDEHFDSLRLDDELDDIDNILQEIDDTRQAAEDEAAEEEEEEEEEEPDEG